MTCTIFCRVAVLKEILAGRNLTWPEERRRFPLYLLTPFRNQQPVPIQKSKRMHVLCSRGYLLPGAFDSSIASASAPAWKASKREPRSVPLPRPYFVCSMLIEVSRLL